MRIDNYLMKIEKNFREKNIQSAFQLINDLKTEYPKTTRIDQFFKQNNFKYIKKMKISSNEIEILYSKKNSQEIKTIVNNFLKKEPENAYVYSFLGNYYGKINELNNARMYQEKAILSNPYEESFYINLATTYKFLGSLDLSIKILEYILLIHPKNETTLLLHADVCFISSQFKKSFSSYENLISFEQKSKNTKYKKEYCHKLIISNKLEKAKNILKELVEEKDLIDVLYYKSLILIEENEFKKAYDYVNKCFEINKQYVQGYIVQGIILERQQKFEEAIKHLKKALTIERNNISALRNLGMIYSHIGNLDEAISYLDKTINLEPNDHESKYILGQIQLYKKIFKEGWKNYESRWLCKYFKEKKFFSSKPLLTNLDNLNNVFLWPEQGIGDQIMYGSMINQLSKLCNKLTVRLDERLIKLFDKKNPDVKFIGKKDMINDTEFDHHMSLVDLGKFFRLNTNEFKKTKFPYITYEKKLSTKIKNSFKQKNQFIIGISWTSKNKEMGEDKSINLKNLLPILKLKNITFLDLEYENSEEEKQHIYEKIGTKIYRISEIDYFNDILGVSSIINACDLIITCSNINAHLSGALGKQTFLLLPIGKGRLLNWSSINHESVWYPSIKIFQQTNSGNWSDPIDKIREEVLNCQTC